jgi:hypothetical protein
MPPLPPVPAPFEAAAAIGGSFSVMVARICSNPSAGKEKERERIVLQPKVVNGRAVKEYRLRQNLVDNADKSWCLSCLHLMLFKLQAQHVLQEERIIIKCSGQKGIVAF